LDMTVPEGAKTLKD